MSGSGTGPEGTPFDQLNDDLLLAVLGLLPEQPAKPLDTAALTVGCRQAPSDLQPRCDSPGCAPGRTQRPEHLLPTAPAPRCRPAAERVCGRWRRAALARLPCSVSLNVMRISSTSEQAAAADAGLILESLRGRKLGSVELRGGDLRHWSVTLVQWPLL